MTRAQPSPSGDELRVRAFLRALHVRPFGHQEPPPMPHDPEKQPITPTRIIPSGAPLPARPPEPGEVPPWRTTEPAPAPPPPPPPPSPSPSPAVAAPPGDVVVRHVHEVLLVVPEAEQDEPGLWARVWDWLWPNLVTWRMVLALLAALLPWAGGQSPVGIWSHTLHQARTENGIGTAYSVAAAAIALTWGLDRHTGRALPRALLLTALLGAGGVLDWYDPILLITGVHR